MALKFAYTAMDGQGKEQRGKIDADNAQDAAAKLKQQGLFPTGISEVKGSGPAKGPGAGGPAGAKKAAGGFNFSMSMGTPVIKRKQLTTMTRQLATLLDAGLPLVRALRTLERQARKDPALKRVAGDIANAVEGGSTFSEALAGHPK